MAKDVPPKLATKATSYVLDKSERKKSGRGVVRARLPLFISNEDMDDNKKSLEKSGVLIDGATETVKHKIKKTRRWISWGYDDTYRCFIDSIYAFFIDTTNLWLLH